MAAEIRNMEYRMSVGKKILFGLMLTAAVYVVILFFLMLTGVKLYIVMSGSMEPEIPTGSLCLVNSQADFYKITKGDVIAFKTQEGTLVTHRVIDVSEEGLETKGDANEVTDGYTTTPENFCGETIGAIPYMGYVHYLVGSKIGRTVCAILIFYACLYRNRKGKRSEQGEKGEFLRKK